jgi:hypothetical protein
MNTELNAVQQVFLDKYEGEARKRVLEFMQEKNRKWDRLLQSYVQVQISYSDSFVVRMDMTVANVLAWRRDSGLSSLSWHVTLPSGKRLYRSVAAMAAMRWSEQAASDRELDRDLHDAFCS